MKNLIKRMLVNMIFTAEERNVMTNALNYSELRYRKRGNTDRALLVGIVKSHIQGFFKPKKNVKQTENNYITKEEITKLVMKTSALTAIFIMKKIRKEIMEIVNNSESENDGEEVEVFIHKYDIEKCAECKNKEKCSIYRYFHENENVDEKPEEKHDEPENGGDKPENSEPSTKNK